MPSGEDVANGKGCPMENSISKREKMARKKKGRWRRPRRGDY